jgi:PilZ domain
MTPPPPSPGHRPSAYRRFVAAVLARALGGPAGLAPTIRAERRRVPRRPAPPAVRATVRLGAPDEAPDVALGLVDFSEDGAGLRLWTAVRPGEDTYLDLCPPGVGPIRRRAAVVWCQPVGTGSFRAGVRFREQLTTEDLRVLVH